MFTFFCGNPCPKPEIVSCLKIFFIDRKNKVYKMTAFNFSFFDKKKSKSGQKISLKKAKFESREAKVSETSFSTSAFFSCWIGGRAPLPPLTHTQK